MGDGAQTQASASAGGSTAGTNPGGNYVAQGLTAAGGITSALAQYTAGKTNQRIADANAKIAEAQREEVINAGTFAANRASLRGRQVEAAQQAAQAGGGVVVGAGTSGNVIQSTEQATAVDSMMIQRNAAREALGYTIKAGTDRMAGTAAAETGKMQALGTLLNAGSEEWIQSDSTFRGYHGSGVRFG